MMDMSGPDLQAVLIVDQMKELILESVNLWKNVQEVDAVNSAWGTVQVYLERAGAHRAEVIYSQLSGLEDVVFNDFSKDDFIPEG